MDHLARTSAYFDGELPPDEADAAAAHLATCAECQQLLHVAAGIDATLPPPPPVRVAATPRARTPWLAAGGAIVAAAAVILVVLHPWRGAPPPAPEATIALAPDRAVEARFSAPAFAAYRPYRPDRANTVAREPIPLSYLAQLEAKGDREALIAALASSGELARAKDLAEAMPASEDAENDRAAVALAAHDPEAALEHAYASLDYNTGRHEADWNLALAARDLGLRHLAIARIQVIDEGWNGEGRVLAQAWNAEVAPEREYAAFRARGRAMLDGGAPLTVADAAQWPANTRIDFLDAVRLADTKDRLDALRPLATALDALTGAPTATAAIDRVTPAWLAAHHAFGADYRKLLDHRLDAAATAKLVAALRGGGADDLTVGVLLFTRDPSLAALAPVIAAWHDPWFDVPLLLATAGPAAAAGDLRVAPALEAALATCSGDALALRCAQLASNLATLHAVTGFDARAEELDRRAMAGYQRAGVLPSARFALAQIADRHRLLGRTALARAELEDLELAADAQTTDDCDAQRSARVDLADLAVGIGAWERARIALPPIDAPKECSPDLLLPVGLAVDIARHTHDDRDLTIAKAWLADLAGAVKVNPASAATGMFALGTMRISPTDSAAAFDWLRATAPLRGKDPEIDGLRDWGYATLIDDAAAKLNWPQVLADARAELDPTGKRPAAPCTLVASFDDGRLAIAATTPDGTAIGQTSLVPPAQLQAAQLVTPALAGQLAHCRAIEVIARAPLHGRADLLPPDLRWYFAGDRPVREAAAGAKRVVEVIDAHPPATLGLAALPPMRGRAGFDATLAGDAATPAATLAALATATYAELHVHGVVAATQDAAAFLALSPDPRGDFALRADAVRAAHFTAAPTIVLAACRASAGVAQLAPRWSLPGAFLAAGAGAVIAVDRPIDDASARPIFDQLRALILGGMPIETAVAAIRSDPKAPAWARRLMVFR